MRSILRGVPVSLFMPKTKVVVHTMNIADNRDRTGGAKDGGVQKKGNLYCR